MRALTKKGEQIRAEFESFIKTSSRFSSNTPLGAMVINGKFSHYMDSDTDTMWIGFANGYCAREKLQNSRTAIIKTIKNKGIVNP